MQDDLNQNARPYFFELSPRELESLVVDKLGLPKFRAQQLREWVYVKGVVDPQEMTNLSRLDRAKINENIEFVRAVITSHQISSDGTHKLLLTWPDGSNAETVMIPDADRRTACVSSQVGCPVGCRFCASGVGGVKGNLSAGQIVEQVVQLNRVMLAESGRSLQKSQRPDAPTPVSASVRRATSSAPAVRLINHIVFMGMGEPLANYASVMKAVRILHDPGALNISARKITISTVGVPKRMRDLAEEELPLNLAISLHAPEEGLRKALIPWAEHFSLDEILDAARYYFDKTGREITLEYILLSGVNDQAQHARALANLCKTLRANVNLIRYNEVETLPFSRPKSEDVMVFQDVLRANGVNAHVRKSRGRDIDAACGQLRKRQEDRTVSLHVAKGFTLVELLVGIGVMVILMAIFIPYLAKVREDDRRVRCADNLRSLRDALQEYAKVNNFNLPRVRYDPDHRPNGYTAYTGADDTEPFAAASAVEPNDVTASLWLLVRGDTSPRKFVCPGSDDQRDTKLDASGELVSGKQRGNFRRPWNLSYSYAIPFGNAPGYRFSTDQLPAKFVILADKNPGVSGAGDDVTTPLLSSPFTLARANSNNHGKAGQNVLYAYGGVVFVHNVYVGVNNDNIYTALAPAALNLAENQDPARADEPGVVGAALGPAWRNDTYLVPTDDDLPK